MSKKDHVELAVIGAGPGGYAAAFRAADLGKQVLLIDKDPNLGGVCLNRGCIPSKALLHIAKVLREALDLEKKGISFSEPKIDLKKLRSWKEEIVGQLNSGILQMAKARKLKVITGRAEFKSNINLKVVTDNGEKEFTFENAIIATGSKSIIPLSLSLDIPGVMTSADALELKDIPEKMLVIGGGYIGLELGTVYAALGSKVSVVEMLPDLLSGADQDLVRLLRKNLDRSFEKIILNTQVKSLKKKKGGKISVTMQGESGSKVMVYDKVLVSVGRQPNTSGLGLDKAGVDMDEHKFINTDEYCRTSSENIFAIGDAAGHPLLAHKATHEGKVAAEVIAGLPAVFDVRAIPAVIYTDPEIAWAGLTEMEAKEKEIPYEKGEFPWAASGRAIVVGNPNGKTKILFDPKTKSVLGAGIVGSNAGDLISEAVLAIEMGADADDLSLSIHPHPTLSETVSNAAEVFMGTVTDLYIPHKN